MLNFFNGVFANGQKSPKKFTKVARKSPRLFRVLKVLKVLRDLKDPKDLIALNLLTLASEIQHALIPHVHQQVEDAEVGQETVLLLKHLVVAPRHKVGIGQRMLRANRLAEVIHWHGEVGLLPHPATYGATIGCQRAVDVEQLTHF